MNVLRKWLTKATPAERTALAKGAATTVGNLRQIAGGYRQTAGIVKMSPEMARLTEIAAERLRRKNPELPELPRTELCPACGRCEFAKALKK